MYIYAKYIKGVGKDAIQRERGQLKKTYEEGKSDALPLLRIANSLANKVSYGSVRETTIRKYISAIDGSRGGGARGDN